MIFTAMLQFTELIQGEWFPEMLVDIAFRLKHDLGQHKGRLGADTCIRQKFREDICDELGGEQLRGNVCFLMECDEAAKGTFHKKCVLTVQHMKAVFHKLFIITKCIGTVKMHP